MAQFALMFTKLHFSDTTKNSHENGTFVGEFVVEICLIVSNSSCIGSLAPEDANRSNSGDTPA